MGNGVSSEFKRLLMERKLMRIKPSKNLIFKEVKAAKSDLEDVVDVVLTSVSSPT